MQNCIILGSGRSGTSMVAGSLAKAGYYMGDQPLRSRASNPKGFFEDRRVNRINEMILEQVTPRRNRFLGFWLNRDKPRRKQYWLSRLQIGVSFPKDPNIENQIISLLTHEPFCFKDPRFSYTLPVWKPFIKNTVFICVFRDPASTIASILKECKSRLYLRDLIISEYEVMEVWELMYKHILDRHCQEGNWLFLHYDQVLHGNGLKKIHEFTGACVDYTFPEKKLRRCVSEKKFPQHINDIYFQLCQKSGYSPH